MSYNHILLTPLTITLSPKECLIDNEIFEFGDIERASKYMNNLIYDINNISSDIKFSYGGHEDPEYYDYKKCKFSIDWEF